MKTLKWHVGPRDGEGELWVYLQVWDGDRYCGRASSSLDPSMSVKTTAYTMASLARNMGCEPETFAETALIGGLYD